MSPSLKREPGYLPHCRSPGSALGASSGLHLRILLQSHIQSEALSLRILTSKRLSWGWLTTGPLKKAGSTPTHCCPKSSRGEGWQEGSPWPLPDPFTPVYQAILTLVPGSARPEIITVGWLVSGTSHRGSAHGRPTREGTRRPMLRDKTKHSVCAGNFPHCKNFQSKQGGHTEAVLIAANYCFWDTPNGIKSYY